VRILVAHVGYRRYGGEDRVVATEAALLRAAGHEVRVLDIPPVRTVRDAPFLLSRAAGLDTLRSRAHRALSDSLEDSAPDVLHLHNVFPLLGADALRIASGASVPVVQTLHNFRMSCLAGTHLRSGRICEECSPGQYDSGITYACYRDSRTESRIMARMVNDYWRSAVVDGGVARFIVLTEFAANRLAGHGVSEDRVVVKANSVESGRVVPYADREGAAFVGRLSPEKGALSLVEAWPADYPTLRLVGDGPDRARVEERAGENVVLVGHVEESRVREIVAAARVLVLPSVWYEGGFPLSGIEALAEETPVVAFRIGSMEESASPPWDCVELRDFPQLAARALNVMTLPKEEWNRLSAATASAFRSRYSNERNTADLVAVYESATGNRTSGGSPR
jgi:glycosyltransferase involved in cell wall biosynthesis